MDLRQSIIHAPQRRENQPSGGIQREVNIPPPEVAGRFDITHRYDMPEIEIFDKNEKLMLKVDIPFLPAVGEYVSIEREDYFKYYIVKERWIRIDSSDNAVACIEVDLRD
jgi:hypothetical protein